MNNILFKKIIYNIIYYSVILNYNFVYNRQKLEKTSIFNSHKSRNLLSNAYTPRYDYTLHDMIIQLKIIQLKII